MKIGYNTRFLLAVRRKRKIIDILLVIAKRPHKIMAVIAASR